MAAALCLLLILAACGPKTGAPKPGAPQATAQELWQSIAAPSAEEARSFTLSASLSVVSPQKSARLLAKFWGDLDRPLRLDLSTGMGQIFAMWREDSLGWLAVYPLSNQAFTHPDTKAALARLGMPFPFGMKELAAISCGRWSLILPGKFSSSRKTAKGFQYSLGLSSPVESVTLDFAGNPIHLTGRGVAPWTVDLDDFSPPETGGRPLARKITVTSPGGIQAILRIKKLELQPAAMAGQGLELALPPGARHIPLDRAGDVRAPEMP
ncbi:MAG: hypothetical protein ACOZEN_15855 [Thermodesulfobacteriota bacterium]